jgi:hypothetical protein
VAAAGPAWAPVVVEAIRGRLKNADEAIRAGVQASGSSIEALTSESKSDPFKQQLSLDAIEFASRSAYSEKIRALGRAWASGVMSVDEGLIAQEWQLIRTLSRVELPHIRVLEVVEGSFVGAPGGATALISGLTPEMIQLQRSEYGPMLGQLIAVLRSEGLIYDGSINNEIGRPGEEFLITPVGSLLLNRLREAASDDSSLDGNTDHSDER